jgi:hypothetical protein
LEEKEKAGPKYENIIDLNVKDMKENFERIPGHIKYQKKLI